MKKFSFLVFLCITFQIHSMDWLKRQFSEDNGQRVTDIQSGNSGNRGVIELNEVVIHNGGEGSSLEKLPDTVNFENDDKIPAAIRQQKIRGGRRGLLDELRPENNLGLAAVFDHAQRLKKRRAAGEVKRSILGDVSELSLEILKEGLDVVVDSVGQLRNETYDGLEESADASAKYAAREMEIQEESLKIARNEARRNRILFWVQIASLVGVGSGTGLSLLWNAHNSGLLDQ
ncbi:hypothetical protein A3F06_01345 [candidate division TM6 bacterium RIFCSPHIGHO2_12_FULL_36_22]|nr:MAG: hypothetical protein A3F06_01345 [candidate division TM6 bacterium RIFCSPHIGHO2_12_FULL_36_22]